MLPLHAVYAASQSVQATSTVPVQALHGIKVRSGPGFQYQSVGILRRNEVVRSTVTDGNWTIIRYGGGEGYVLTRYMRVLDDAELSNSFVRLQADIEVLSGPSDYARVIGVALAGEYFQLLAVNGDWCEIDYYGNRGVIAGLYAELPEGMDSGDAANADAADTSQDTTFVEAPAGSYVQVNGVVAVRSEPSAKSSELGRTTDGALLPKLGASGVWVRVEFNRRVAYIELAHVEDSAFVKAQTVAEGGYEVAAQEFIVHMNGYRTDAGMQPLAVSTVLTEAAKIRAEELSRVFSHTRPDGTMCNSLAPEAIMGENIARGTTIPTPESAARGFMSADTHRKNAMDPQYERTGAACFNLDGELFWVQLFGN